MGSHIGPPGPIWERRSSETTELSRLRESEGCAACDDAKPPKPRKKFAFVADLYGAQRWRWNQAGTELTLQSLNHIRQATETADSLRGLCVGIIDYVVPAKPMHGLCGCNLRKFRDSGLNDSGAGVKTHLYAPTSTKKRISFRGLGHFLFSRQKKASQEEVR